MNPDCRILLIRGLTREGRHWGQVPNQLSQKMNEPVCTADLPGFGEAADEMPPLTILQTMEVVRSRTKAQKKLHLVGLSLGGMVVYEWVRRHPEEIQSFVLINSSFGSLSPFYKRLRWQIYKQIVDLTLAQGARERERRILEIVANNAERREEVLLDWVKIAQDKNWKSLHILKQLAAAARYRPSMKPVSVPGLVISSLGDRLMDPSCPKTMAQRLEVPMVTHPWAGHDLGVDDPQWLVDRLVDFWRSK